MAAFLLLLLLLGATGAGADLVPGPLETLTQVELKLQPLQQEPAVLLPVTLQQEQEPPKALPPRWGSDLASFPPARPGDDATVARLCRHPQPAAVSPSDLPRTGFSHLRRQAEALGHLQRRLRGCCHQPQPLPCAQQAWLEVLDSFCEDEFRVKTRHYRCCLRHGSERQRCFEEAAGDDGTAAAPQPVETPRLPPPLAFPPGEPTEANMGNICRLRRFRLAAAASPPAGSTGRSSARAVARLERDYKGCCRSGGLDCARAAWRQTLGRFCQEESAVKTQQPRCCRRGAGDARWRCFAAEAPQPAYDRELRAASLAPLRAPLLHALCTHAQLLTKRKPVLVLVQNITDTCCPRDDAERVACAEEEKSRSIDALCSSLRGSWKDPEHCCDATERHRCFDSRYLAQVEVASATPELLPQEQD
ncbi:extracellular matrix protein 1 [Nothoprocta perdicaria]|uniref:extracellular matrix protein 1 n=1 Tax=Nothoprocta perdicaria TaxID=30464 RepID=UPI000E1BC43A|nr:extracellular matrix protein 1 [Nothoprocta perdicaria]